MVCVVCSFVEIKHNESVECLLHRKISIHFLGRITNRR